MTTLALDTSVLVPFLADWHAAHDTARDAVGDGDPVIPAHVLAETFSVLTRAPAPNRIPAAAVAEALGALAADVVALDPEEVRALIVRMGATGIRGGAIYDAVIGATAATHGLTLLTRDRRALTTYEAVGATYRTV